MRFVGFLVTLFVIFLVGCTGDKTRAEESRTEETPAAAAKTTAAGFDQPPTPIERPTPAYPDEARKAGRTGLTHLSVQIDAMGTVLSAKVAQSSGHADLDQAAMEAAMHWTFEPAKLHGKPVPAEIVIPFQFALD